MPFRTDEQRRAAFARQQRPSAKPTKALSTLKRPGDVLHTTKPHGAQRVRLVEDQPKAKNRIYGLQTNRGEIGILGSELDSLARWWQQEKLRKGQAVIEPGESYEAQRRQLDPKGYLKSELARKLAADSSLDLGGYLAAADDWASTLDAIGVALEQNWLAPESEAQLRETLRQILRWAKIPARGTSMPDRQGLIGKWTKRLQRNQQELESAIAKASADYPAVTPFNSRNIAIEARRILGQWEANDAALRRVQRRVEDLPSAREVQQRDADDRREAYP